MSRNEEKGGTTGQVQALFEQLQGEEAFGALRDALERGEVPVDELHTRVARIAAEDPRVASLTENARKGLVGRLTSQLQRAMPKKQAAPTLAERVVGMGEEARRAWRQELIEQSVTPVSLLLDRLHQTQALPRGAARRRDLGWDAVTAAITAVRYATMLALAAYVRDNPDRPLLNRALLDALGHPSDGTWSALLFAPPTGKENSLLAVLRSRGTSLPGLAALDAKLPQPVRAFLQEIWQAGLMPGKQSPENVQTLAEAFTQFRNELVHGRYSRERPGADVLEALCGMVDVLCACLEPLLVLPVVVRVEGEVRVARGAALAPPGQPPALPADWDGTPLALLPSPAGAGTGVGGGLPLAPWMTVADVALASARLEYGNTGAAGDLAAYSLHELCFFNRFESSALHLLGVAARAQVPHGALPSAESAEEAYQAFAQALERLRHQAAPGTARSADPIMRFDELAQAHGENFVGRSDLLQSIASFVADAEDSGRRMGVIRAEPGLGKSALLSHFYRVHGQRGSTDGWVFHFSARADHRDHPVLGLRSLVAQIGKQARALGATAPAEPLPWVYADLVTRFRTSLVQLGGLALAQGRSGVVVIDALDEQAPRPGAPPDSIFGALPEEIPPGVVVIVSVRIAPDGRPVAIEPGQLSPPRAWPIQGASPMKGLTPADVRALVFERLGQPQVEEPVLARIARAAKRQDDTLDPFYLRFLADGVREGSIRLDTPADVPESLDAFFSGIWWSLDPADDLLLHRMLGLLSVMEGFADDALLAAVLHRPEDEVARQRFGINKLLVQSGGAGGAPRYGLFHDRFRWFVRGRFRARDEALHLHHPLLVFCRQGGSQAGHYAVRQRSAHLAALARHPGLVEEERAAYRDELWALVHDEAFIVQKFEATADETAIGVDFMHALDVFRPRAGDAPAARLAGGCAVTALALQSCRVLAESVNLARARLHRFAAEGDAVRVLQLVERTAEPNLRCLTLLRAVATMHHAEQDPALLLEALESGTWGLLAEDRAVLERLLKPPFPGPEVAQRLRDAVSPWPDPLGGALHTETP